MSLLSKIIGSSGGTSSQSASTTNTTTIDKRLVADAGAIGVSADDSTVTLNLLDAGAIQGAFDLAKSGNAQTMKSIENVLGLASSVFTIQRDTGRQAISAAENVRGAFDSAANIAAGNKTLVIVAVVGVAVVAALALIPSLRKAARG